MNAVPDYRTDLSDMDTGKIHSLLLVEYHSLSLTPVSNLLGHNGCKISKEIRTLLTVYNLWHSVATPCLLQKLIATEYIRFVGGFHQSFISNLCSL